MVVFRADGNKYIGSGHIMRCISIADRVVLHGTECVFITAGGEFSHMITSHGHKNKVLHTEYNHMEQEADPLFSAMNEVECLEAVFVDSYQVTSQYLNRLWEFCKAKSAKLVYIDDILSFAYPCDVLVNYNIYEPDSNYDALYEGFGPPFMLLGTSYVPLRAEFQDLPARNVRKKGREVLISTGGADFEHIGIQILREILMRGESLSDYHFHFIIGAMNEDANEMHRLVKQYAASGNKHIALHSNVARMQELMRNADVCISAAGSTLYELCAANTPTITYVLADNQIPGADGFSRHGVLENIGDVRKLSVQKLSGLLVDSAVELCKDFEKRVRIASKMSAVVDGKGAERIVESVLGQYKRNIQKFQEGVCIGKK